MATSPVFDGLTLTGLVGFALATAGSLSARSLVVADMPFAIKYGTTTHDISLAAPNNTTVVTELGFTPTVLILFTGATLSGNQKGGLCVC